MQPTEKPAARLEPVLLILSLVLLVIVGLQTFGLVQEGGQIAAIRLGQDAAVAQGEKIRAQLDSLANETAKMADKGNANAKAIVEDLKKQGITVKPKP